MKLRNLIFLGFTHAAVGAGGFALGIYALPILIAPPAPTAAEIATMADTARFSAEFRKDLQDSDALHWGEGKVMLSDTYITFAGELAPGPDYKLYLSPQFVETEAQFHQLKSTMVRIGDVKTFTNFVVSVPDEIDIAAHNTVIVWCETFGQFITAGQYR